MDVKRGRRRLHGWLVVDKPTGMTSAQVVSRVRSITGAAKAGHAGTLDPGATGVMPVALGEATKTVHYMMAARKHYQFTVRWGEERTTDDSEGDVIAVSPHRPTCRQIESVLPRFTGCILQRPPSFSAIKINGQRSYSLARKAKVVDLPERRVEVHELSLIEHRQPDFSEFEMRCGKGVYVRSLSRDLGRALNTYGYVSRLRRLSVGPFDESLAISLDKLAVLGHSAAPQDYLLPIEAALADIPAVLLSEAEAEHLRHGRAVRVSESGENAFVERLNIKQDGPLYVMSGGRPVALARLRGEMIQPVRVLNL